MYIKPWNAESERILKRLSRNGRTFSYDTNISRDFGQKYKEVMNKEYIDFATTRYSRRKDKTLFQVNEKCRLRPKETRRGIKFYIEQIF